MEKPSYTALFSLLLGVAILWGICGVALYGVKERGTFGDMFGAVNALFSGLAFAGIIYTILLQRKELELQREELRATRAEMARSASAQEKSERALQIQAEAAEVGQRLVAINNMMEFSNLCQERLRTQVLGAQEMQRCNEWADRRHALIDELDKVFAEVVSRRRSVRPL